jgi:septal ring factor EnvC (AmiA/AmiB activator)
VKEFIDVLLQVITVVLSIAVTFGLTLWKGMERRMDNVEKDKADRDEVDELRNELKLLSNAMRQSNDMAGQLNVAIARITEQMARVASDIESEKRTRSDANKEIMAAIRETKADIIRQVQQNMAYGRRKTDQPS